jgi:hypothetical protein
MKGVKRKIYNEKKREREIIIFCEFKKKIVIIMNIITIIICKI